jgi:aminopeptidase N
LVQIFDSISYNKGAAILRMMANFIGVENFNKGIERYLKRHQFGNAKQVPGINVMITNFGEKRCFSQKPVL